MDAAQAMSLVVARIRDEGIAYPTENLIAAQFYGGWCVYSPTMIADEDPPPDAHGDVIRSVFLVGDPSGRIDRITSGDSGPDARDWFEESCIWFSASETGAGDYATTTLPSNPDLSGSVPARQPAAYDRQALDTFAQALVQEPDFAGWLAGRLRDLADLLGSGCSLVARRSRSDEAKHVAELAALDDADLEDENRTKVWQTWPAVDPANLPGIDVSGWLLVPGATACEYLESIEGETTAAGPFADAIADRTNPAPPWRACGVTELRPQLVAIPRGELPAAGLGDDVFDAMLLAPSPGDDIDALLRIAVDAGERSSEIVEIDAAATAAYRRVLDRLDLPFENYWYDAMFE